MNFMSPGHLKPVEGFDVEESKRKEKEAADQDETSAPCCLV